MENLQDQIDKVVEAGDEYMSFTDVMEKYFSEDDMDTEIYDVLHFAEINNMTKNHFIDVIDEYIYTKELAEDYEHLDDDYEEE